jgi:hypothetical protein
MPSADSLMAVPYESRFWWRRGGREIVHGLPVVFQGRQRVPLVGLGILELWRQHSPGQNWADVVLDDKPEFLAGHGVLRCYCGCLRGLYQ